VLLDAAEDALHIVRLRLEGICAAAGLRLAELDVQVITAPCLRLDLEADRRNLAETVAMLQPRLLMLDPFVRLHRIDENASGEVAPLLAYLRELQRRHAVAVMIVHHAKKGGARVRAGQALRGSSEFHAWGDSNLYLRRQAEDLVLSVEHRAAPSIPPVSLELAQRGDALALEVADRRAPVTTAANSLDERITSALAETGQPLPFADLRSSCRVRARPSMSRSKLLLGQSHRQSGGGVASPAADCNHDEWRQCPGFLPFPELSTACGNGTGKSWITLPGILRFGPRGAHSPVPATQSPSRRAQWLSRPALFRAAEGLVWTAASTAAD
jgi:hypothetical protein